MTVSFQNRFVYPCEILKPKSNKHLLPLCNYPVEKESGFEMAVFGADGHMKIVEVSFSVMAQVLTTADLLYRYGIISLFDIVEYDTNKTISNEYYYHVAGWHHILQTRNQIISSAHGQVELTATPISNALKQNLQVRQLIEKRHANLTAQGVRIDALSQERCDPVLFSLLAY